MAHLIDQLWKRVDAAQLTLLDARATGDAKATKTCGLEYRCLALAMSSVPASILAEVELKMLLAALYREEPDDGSYTLTMIEYCIVRDNARLQGRVDTQPVFNAGSVPPTPPKNDRML
jgi:hypothetical protein